MPDSFDDWPDVRQTRESRAEFIAAELARLIRTGDPFESQQAKEGRRRASARQCHDKWEAVKKFAKAEGLSDYEVWTGLGSGKYGWSKEAKHGQAQQRGFDQDRMDSGRQGAQGDFPG